MSRISIPLLLLGILLIVVVVLLTRFRKDDRPRPKLPLPFETVIVDDDEAQKQVDRLAWIESMHKAAPGVNWRRMDEDHRRRARRNGPDTLPVYGKWRELGSNNQAGRTHTAYFDTISGQVWMAVSGGQIWRGTIGEEDWEPVNDHLKITGIHFIRRFHDQDGIRLAVASDRWNVPGFLFSDDEGHTWDHATGLETVEDWGFIRRAVMLDDTSRSIYLVAQEWDYVNWQSMSRIYKSVDMGTSFAPLHSFEFDAARLELWAPHGSSEDLFVMADNSFYHLNSYDELIHLSDLPAPGSGKTLMTGFDAGNGIIFYAMIRYEGVSYFYQSSIGGSNWQATGTLSEGPFMVNSFTSSISQQGLLYFGGVNAYRSPTSGSTWNIVNQWYEYYDSPEDKLHADIPGFDPFFDENGNEVVLINTDGGVYVSYDRLENVQNLSLNNLRISQYYSSYTCRFDPQWTHTGSQDQGYQKSNEGDQQGAINYDQVISGDYGNIVSGDEGASLWMVYPGFAMYCRDVNNSNWLGMWDFVGDNYQWLPKLMADPDDPASVYVAGGRTSSGAHLFHVSNVGSSFQFTEEPFDFSNGTDASITAVAFSPLEPDHRYVFTSEGDFFYSLDDGISWQQSEGFTGPGSHYFYGATITPSNLDEGTLYLGGSGYSAPPVYVSTDHGETFSAYDSGLPSTMVFQLALSSDDSLLFAATEVGAFVCKTWEDQWYSLSDTVVPDQSFWAVDFIPSIDVARFSTYGRGAWDFDLNPDVEADFTADILEIYEGDSVSFTDLSRYNPVAWEWTFSGGDPTSSTEQHPQKIAYHDPGLFNVELIAHNDHSTDTLERRAYIRVSPITSTGPDRAGRELLQIFPNPARRYTQIMSDVPVDEIHIYDVNGKIVFRHAPGDDGFESYRISTLGWEPGTYLVTVRTIKRTIATKLVVAEY